jgi:hypothetical protein
MGAMGRMAAVLALACGAMALTELDKVGYQWKLEQYARFLVETQCTNGQWDYGERFYIPRPKNAPPVGTQVGSLEPKPVLTGGGGAPPAAAPPTLYGAVTDTAPIDPSKKPGTQPHKQPAKRIVVQQTRRGPPFGDNSNSQYAALGLRACAEAGIDIDPRCLKKALAWWEGCKKGDGGFGHDRGGTGDPAWGSMTVGGVGALIIYDWLLGKPWKTDKSVLRGMKWLNDNWDLTKNPRSEFREHLPRFQYYYLYGIERVGMLYGTDMIGEHDWYEEGARYLLNCQLPNDGWQSNHGSSGALDTCFAVLFLRRSTKPLPPAPKVPTGQ